MPTSYSSDRQRWGQERSIETSFVTTCDNIWFFFHLYLLFITCTFIVSHMTDDFPFLTWLTWSHTLLSHVTHRFMTHVDLGWLIVTHWCFTFNCFTYICFIFCFMTHTRTSIVLVTYCSRDVHYLLWRLLSLVVSIVPVTLLFSLYYKVRPSK